MVDDVTCHLRLRATEVKFFEKPEIAYVGVECDTDLNLLPQKCGRRARSQEDRSRRNIKKMQQNHENIMANINQCFKGLEALMKGRI